MDYNFYTEVNKDNNKNKRLYMLKQKFSMKTNI